jgi:hypothetical protein
MSRLCPDSRPIEREKDVSGFGGRNGRGRGRLSFPSSSFVTLEEGMLLVENVSGCATNGG